MESQNTGNSATNIFYSSIS